MFWFRLSVIYFITKSTLKFVPERIISRWSERTQQNQNICERIRRPLLLGPNRKIVLHFFRFLSLSPLLSVYLFCSVCPLGPLHSQAIALLNNPNNKCSTRDFAKVLHLKCERKCLQENYLLFRSIFLWWCFSHFIPFMWCTHPVKRKPILHLYHLHPYEIITSSMQDMYRNDSNHPV